MNDFPADALRDLRERRDPHDPAERGDLVRQVPRHVVVPGVYDLRRPLVREEECAGVDLRHGEQLELERRDDAEGAAAATHGPEQVGLLVVVDAAQLAVGCDELDRGQRIRWRPCLRPSQPTPPPSEYPVIPT